MEAEYMGLTDASNKSHLSHRILKELGSESLAHVTLYNDNQGAGKLASNHVFHSRSKHINIKREWAQLRTV